MMYIQYKMDFPELLNEKGLLLYPAAEIGVAEGRFSLDLLSWGFPKLYLVDVWESRPERSGDVTNAQHWHDSNFDTVKKNTEQYGNRVVFLRGLSTEMALQVEDESLGFIYLDAGHSYEDVFADLTAWVQKVRIGGIVAGHDYLNQSYGVNRAVNDFVQGKYDVHTIPENHINDAGFWFLKDK